MNDMNPTPDNFLQLDNETKIKFCTRPWTHEQETEEMLRAINGAIEQASRELKRCKQTCRANGSPIRSITFRVMDDGNTKLHVTYKRK